VANKDHDLLVDTVLIHTLHVQQSETFSVPSLAYSCLDTHYRIRDQIHLFVHYLVFLSCSLPEVDTFSNLCDEVPHSRPNCSHFQLHDPMASSLCRMNSSFKFKKFLTLYSPLVFGIQNSYDFL